MKHMNSSPKSASINCDVNNPGHVLASCGLLELSHRLCPASEGWFSNSRFHLSCSESNEVPDTKDLINKLSRCKISGLSHEEQEEREHLEEEMRSKKKFRMELDDGLEKRRKSLGDKAREGPLYLGEPFNFRLDWWVSEEAYLKTWTGRQELQRIVEAMQAAILEIKDAEDMFDFGSPLREASTQSEAGKRRARVKKVEPFYFDARRFTHRLDMGFSLDELKAESIAYPLVELLSLIGLQRFRPARKRTDEFEYILWDHPLGVASASSVFCGAFHFPGSLAYKFRLRHRDDKKLYKGFSFSELIS